MSRHILRATLATALTLGLAAPLALSAGSTTTTSTALATSADVDAVIERQYEGFLATMPQIVSLLGLPGADEE